MALQKNLVDGIGKNEGLSISIGREAVSMHSSSAIGKYQPEFYDLFKITLLVILVWINCKAYRTNMVRNKPQKCNHCKLNQRESFSASCENGQL